jgi:hypothetical protein
MKNKKSNNSQRLTHSRASFYLLSISKTKVCTSYSAYQWIHKTLQKSRSDTMTFSYANAATNKQRPEDTTVAKTPAWNGNKQVKQEQHQRQHQRKSQSLSQTQQQAQQQVNQNNHIKNPPKDNEKLPTTSTWGSIPKKNPSTSIAANTVTVTPVLSRPDNEESRSVNIKTEETQLTIAKAILPKPTNTNNHNDHGNDNNKKGKTIKIEHSNSNNNTEDDSWNVVVTTKKNVTSSTAVTSKNSRTSSSSQPQAIPNNKAGQNKNTSQQPVTKNNTINPNKSNNNNNNNKNPKPKKSPSNDNTKKIPKKPKPMARSIGDMITEPSKKTGLILGKKKNNNNNNDKKKAAQQPHQHQQQQQQHQQQRFPNLQVDNTQDFPTLGSAAAASDTTVSSAVSAASGTKKGWGSLPKTPPASFHPNQVAPKAAGTNKSSSSLSSSLPSKKKKNNSTIFVGAPSRVLKRGEALPKKNMAGTQANGNNSNKKKKSQNKNDSSNKATFASSASSFCSPEIRGVPLSASSFFQPKLRSVDGGDSTAAGGDKGNSTIRGLEGEEHELLRLMQERTVYQKKGRQRVAPRKKKFTALKKKVLQERLDKWRELHPEESDESQKKKNDSTTATATTTNTNRSKDRTIPTTCSLCIYNYTTPEELYDEDEYEEIVENLKGMSLKIGCIDEVFIPRSKLEPESHVNNAGDNNDDGTSRAEDNNNNNNSNKDGNNIYHPAIVKFQKVSDAAAALACWNGLVVGGSILEVVSLDVPTDDDDTTTWSERALAAESKRRNESQASVDEEMMKPIEIIIQKVLTDDDYDDDDCMSESLDDLKQIAEKFGEIKSMEANRTKNGDVVITYLSNIFDARNIAENLCRVVVGGQPLYASVSEQPIEVPNGGSSVTILLENILTEDDLEDNDCLQESLNDIKELCLRYGSVSDVIVKGSAVKITYSEDKSVVEKAVSQLNGTLLGGNTVEASLLIANKESPANDGLDSSIDLHDLLTEDDLEDEDCMEESISDVRKLASKYGEVVTIDVLKVDDDSFLRIRFGGDASIAVKAAEGFRGMVVGGQIINASLSGSIDAKIDVFENSGDKRKPDAEAEANSEKKARTDDKAPLYSGDKLIPERFAEMKRVPKIPNAAGPREYASTTNDERVRPLLAEMLRELMRLQKRAVEDKNAKARRRMVMGLREVARGIRAHKGMLNNIIYEDPSIISLKLNTIDSQKQNKNFSCCYSQNGCHG